MADWLGNKNIANKNKSFVNFKEAKTFAKSLNLKNVYEWNAFCKSSLQRFDIPSAVNRIYKNKGWVSWSDFLGTKNISPQNRNYKSFEEAKKFVQTLNLTSISKWVNYYRSNHLPKDIPKTPNNFYKNKGWTNWGDWLGTNTIAAQLKEYLTFILARKFVKKLKLKSINEWKEYCHSLKKPENIPAAPDWVYKNKGWISWNDFLGKK